MTTIRSSYQPPTSSTNPFDEQPVKQYELPDLSEPCSICLYPLQHKLSADQRTYRTLAETDCNHFFHQFCLDKYLRTEHTTSCPIGSCGKPAVEYSIINLDRWTRLNSPNKQSQDNSSMVQSVAAAGQSVAEAGLGVLKASGNLFYNIAASLFCETKQQFEERVKNFAKNWENTATSLEKTMRENNDNVSLLLTRIKDLPESSQARASFDRIKKAYETVENNLRHNQANLKEILAEEKKNLVLR